MKFSAKAICIFLSMGIFTACSTKGGISETGENQVRSVDYNYEYYNLADAEIPNENYELIKEGILRAEELLKNDEFLSILEKKEDWTYTPNGEPLDGKTVVNVIKTKASIQTSKQVYPKLYFYTPPKWGMDVCGGVTVFPFWETSSTGCSNGSDEINKNLFAIGDSYHIFSEFYIHEWMHAAGFGHGGNKYQCTKEKRNSVPIYVGCAAEQYLRGEDIAQCSKEC